MTFEKWQNHWDQFAYVEGNYFKRDGGQCAQGVFQQMTAAVPKVWVLPQVCHV